MTALFIYIYIIAQHGCPYSILSDNGRNFIADTLRFLLELMGIHQLFTRPYFPSSNGTVERVNGTLVNILKKLSVNHSSRWDQFLLAAIFAYWVSYHQAIKTSPFKPLYGRDATLPSNVALKLPNNQEVNLETAFAHLMKVQLQASDALYWTKTQYTETAASRVPIPMFFKNDQVLVYQSRDSQLSGKLQPSWVGPASFISARVTEYSMKLSNGRVINRIHGKYLKPYPRKNLGKVDVGNLDITTSDTNCTINGNNNIDPSQGSEINSNTYSNDFHRGTTALSPQRSSQIQEKNTSTGVPVIHPIESRPHGRP